MSSLNNTMETAVDTAKHTVESAVDSAKSTMETAKKGTGDAASAVFTKITDGIHAATSAVALVRSLGLNDALGWVGLSRRRSPFESIALFGSGVLVGAGVGMLIAPMSGADLRKAFLARLQGVQNDAKRTVEQVEAKVESGAKAVEQKAEDLAGKAKTAVVSAEHKVEDLAGKAKDAVIGTAKDAVEGAEQKAEDLAGKAKDAVDKADNMAGNAANKAKDAISSAERKADELAGKAKENIANVDRRANGTTTMRHS